MIKKLFLILCIIALCSTLSHSGVTQDKLKVIARQSVAGGALSGCRVFDGSTQYLKYDTGKIQDAGDYPFTVALWFKPDVIDQQEKSLWAMTDKDQDNAHYIESEVINDETINVRARAAAGSAYGYTSNLYTTGWHHACAIITGAASRTISLDGDTNNEGTNTTSVSVANIDSFSVGAQFDSAPGGFFDGKIAFVTIWNIGLTEANCVSLAVAETVPTTIESANVEAYWPLTSDLLDAENSYDLTAVGGGSFDSGDGPW